MIPVQDVEGQTIAVLGLGRSGLSAAKALAAGGARVLVWDDGATGRAAAEAEGSFYHQAVLGVLNDVSSFTDRRNVVGYAPHV